VTEGSKTSYVYGPVDGSVSLCDWFPNPELELCYHEIAFVCGTLDFDRLVWLADLCGGYNGLGSGTSFESGRLFSGLGAKLGG
jgi:hypothetical protein